MRINLQEDYKKLMLLKIKESGLKVPSNYDDGKLIIMYYSYLRKKAFAGPHQIIKSRNFFCPPEYLNGFNKLQEIIKTGGDITPYFNRTASDLSQFDYLFLDWGIMHFHLGDELIEGENLVVRGNPVLFAYLQDNIVYFINVYEHGHWADKDVIQEMYNNWPEVIQKFIYHDVEGVGFSFNSSQLAKLRKKGYTTHIDIKDNKGKTIVMIPPGLGLTKARTSISDTRLFQQTMNQLRNIQLYLISIEEQIIKDMRSNDIEIQQEISFNLVNFDQENLYLLDEAHDYTITVKHA